MAWIGDDDADPTSRLKEDNSARLGRYVLDVILTHIRDDSPLIVTPTLLCDLNRLAMRDIIDRAGFLRQVDLVILGSNHKPPPFQDVPKLVEECCQYLNGDQETSTQLASYALWRTNWIHPFDDGNGRVSRALCYLVFCARERTIPSGRVTLPERICQHPLMPPVGCS